MRSLSSFSSLTRGQACDNHCSLTEFSRGRLSPSIAHTACAIVKLQNPRPQRRQVCASREPCVGLQSSIFTLKSCVFQRFSVIISRPYFEILVETLSHRNQAFGKTASPALGVESEGASWPGARNKPVNRGIGTPRIFTLRRSVLPLVFFAAICSS